MDGRYRFFSVIDLSMKSYIFLASCPVGYCITGTCQMIGNVPQCDCSALYTGQRCETFLGPSPTTTDITMTNLPITTTPPIGKIVFYVRTHSEEECCFFFCVFQKALMGVFQVHVKMVVPVMVIPIPIGVNVSNLGQAPYVMFCQSQ